MSEEVEEVEEATSDIPFFLNFLALVIGVGGGFLAFGYVKEAPNISVIYGVSTVSSVVVLIWMSKILAMVIDIRNNSFD